MPPVFDFVALRLIGLEPEVAGLAGRSMIFLILWPAAIGFRRFYQGILIRNGRPQAVTWGTVIRLSTMSATGLCAALVLRLPGASVGAAALGVGVIAEGAASWAMARPVLRAMRRQTEEECAFGRSLTAAGVMRFYAPLALTSFLSFFINPLTTFFLARGRSPLESLAVLPVSSTSSRATPTRSAVGQRMASTAPFSSWGCSPLSSLGWCSNRSILSCNPSL